MPTLEVTTMIGCPVLCTFCPQENLREQMKGKEKYLTLDNFKTILSKIPKHVRIDFSGTSEPWANPECTSILLHTLKSGYDVVIYTTLYGLSTEEASNVIKIIKEYRLQIKDFVIHLQDQNSNMRGMKLDDEWIMVLNQFLEFYEEKVLGKMSFMTMDESGIVHPKLKPIQSIVGEFMGIARAGSLDLSQINGQKVIIIKDKKGIINCDWTDYYDQNVLLPNGDVLICCMDYNMKHKIGNLINMSYYDLFKSNEFLNLINKNIDPNSSANSSICRQCERSKPAKSRM